MRPKHAMMAEASEWPVSRMNQNAKTATAFTMHRDKHRRRITETGSKDKTAVMGMLERDGEVRAMMVPTRRRKILHGEIQKHIAAGSAIYTDNFMSYSMLPPEYKHSVIDHAEKYVDGRVHTNGLENFWSLVKRGLKGTYISVEPFHLFRYLDEQVYRFNNRGSKENPLHDGERFQMALSQIAGKRLTYEQVTGKVGETAR